MSVIGDVSYPLPTYKVSHDTDARLWRLNTKTINFHIGTAD
jgi:hypothetical protein